MIRDELITIQDPKSIAAEAYRTLRTNIQYSNIDDDIKTIVVTSALPEEGKTTVIANLAISIAYTGKKVLVVDCDLRKPRLHKKFGLSNMKGFTNVLIGDSQFKSTLHFIENMENLHVLTSGPIPPNPSELLGTKRMETLLESFRDQYDTVIIDAPPVGVVTDAAILATKVDGLIFVTAAGQTDVDTIKRSKELLENVKANILGVVLNKVDVQSRDYYKYGYYKYYEDK